MHSSVRPSHVLTSLPSVSPSWRSKTQNPASTCSRIPYSSHQRWLWPGLTGEGHKRARCFRDHQKALANLWFKKKRYSSGQIYVVLSQEFCAHKILSLKLMQMIMELFA